jgi:hypothetical protein
MALDRPIAENGRVKTNRRDRAALPSAAELASLGTVLCVYRSRYGGELGGWAQAVSAESWGGIDSDGWHECLQFRDRNGHCCWRLYLLPDSDFFAWEQLTARLPSAEAMPSPGDGIATRLWRRMASRVGGERWLASVLRLHTMPQPSLPASMPVLAASLAPVSEFGADVVRRIARIEGIDSGGQLDDCCCRQYAVIEPPQVAGGGDAIRHESTRNTMPASGMHHDAFPLIRLHTRTSE